MRVLRKLANGWAKLEITMLATILLMMIVLSVLQIVLRNVFDTSLFWIDPLNRLSVLWLAILGAMVATRERQHIAVDVLKHYLSGRSLVIMDKFTQGFAGVVCAIMSYHSARFVYFEYLDGMTTFSELPAWPFELIMPIGFGIMSARFFAQIFTRVGGTNE
jgi:TRAP-type C4-dicarboxylate transport system permease small subunit